MVNHLELVDIGPRAREFLALEVSENQQGLVATMAESYADALFPSDDGDGLGKAKPWLRGVTRNSVPAGFIMCADPTELQKDAWIWRLLVDKNHQGFGVGRFAVEHAIARYLRSDVPRVLVSWKPLANNPSGFYLKLGFKETGEINHGEIVAALEF